MRLRPLAAGGASTTTPESRRGDRNWDSETSQIRPNDRELAEADTRMSWTGLVRHSRRQRRGRQLVLCPYVRSSAGAVVVILLAVTLAGCGAGRVQHGNTVATHRPAKTTAPATTTTSATIINTQGRAPSPRRTLHDRSGATRRLQARAKLGIIPPCSLVTRRDVAAAFGVAPTSVGGAAKDLPPSVAQCMYSIGGARIDILSYNAESLRVPVRQLVAPSRGRRISGPGYAGYVGQGTPGAGLTAATIAFVKANAAVRIVVLGLVGQRAALIARARALARAAATRL